MQSKAAYLLVLCVLGLVVLGLVVLSSTSPYSDGTITDKMYYTQRQAIWLALGVILCAVAAVLDYHWWQRFVWPLLGVAGVLLIACYLPEIGKRINGSARWISLGPWTFQPSELAKFAVVVFLAHWFSTRPSTRGTFRDGILVPGAVAAVIMVLIVLEVDFGTTLLIGACTWLMMFVGGAGLRYLLPVAGAGAAAMVAVVKLVPERVDRIMAFLDLEAHKLGAGLQQYQGLIAFGSGGVDGLGLGNGRQKMMYLPYAHTDFIFPMIGEELGLRVTLLIVLAYLVITVCGLTIAVHARDQFGKLLGFGVVAMLGLQAVVNIGVTTALLPNKGLPLPFVSYGGSNLIMCLLGVGVLISIHMQRRPQKLDNRRKRLEARVLHGL